MLLIKGVKLGYKLKKKKKAFKQHRAIKGRTSRNICGSTIIQKQEIRNGKLLVISGKKELAVENVQTEEPIVTHTAAACCLSARRG